jgi:Leucine-rich repeat (LRR) protein
VAIIICFQIAAMILSGGYFSKYLSINKCVSLKKVPLTVNTVEKEGVNEFEMILNDKKIWNGDYTFVKSYERNNYSRFYDVGNLLVFHPFANIYELNLVKGQVEDFPSLLNYFVMKSKIGSFSFLKKVSLFKCSITNKDYNTFPSFVKNLAICSCGLKVIPKGLHSNNNLEVLNLAFNKLDFIPDFTACNSLQELDLSFNQITDSTIGKLPKSLSKLILTNNPLKKLPLTILDLENLISLDISATQITELSESLSSVFNLSKLTEVILKYTTIEPIEKKKLVDNFQKVKFIFE